MRCWFETFVTTHPYVSWCVRSAACVHAHYSMAFLLAKFRLCVAICAVYCVMHGSTGFAEAAYCDWAPKNGSLPNTHDPAPGLLPAIVARLGVLHPHEECIVAGNPVLLRKSTMGSVYTAGTAENRLFVAHIYGSSAYELGLAHGTLLKEEVSQLMPAVWAHFQVRRVWQHVCACPLVSDPNRRWAEPR